MLGGDAAAHSMRPSANNVPALKFELVIYLYFITYIPMLDVGFSAHNGNPPFEVSLPNLETIVGWLLEYCPATMTLLEASILVLMRPTMPGPIAAYFFAHPLASYVMVYVLSMVAVDNPELEPLKL